MSGPKVINLEAYRRRRQRESLVRIRELRDTVAEWRSALERAGLLTADLAAEAEAMFGRLENLHESEKWDPLFAEASARRDFFRTGIENAQQAGITRAANLRERRRRLELGVAMLRRELQAAGVPGPPELEEVSRKTNASDETELSRLEALA